jgi:hypothetical protein
MLSIAVLKGTVVSMTSFLLQYATFLVLTFAIVDKFVWVSL